MTQEIKQMPPDVRAKFFEIRCRGKSGGRVTDAESRYIQKMRAKYPDHAHNMESEVFEATRPFGS